MNTDLFSHINWLSVLVAAIAYFFIGAIWYSFLFKSAWIRSSGVIVNDPNAKKGIAGIMFFSFILMIVASIGLALFISKIEPVTWMTGLKVGLTAGICFCATAICNSYLYEKRPLALHLINSFYNIVGCAVAGVIISVWPK